MLSPMVFQLYKIFVVMVSVKHFIKNQIFYTTVRKEQEKRNEGREARERKIYESGEE